MAGPDAPSTRDQTVRVHIVNANALAQLRAPIYEDKVVDFILELANVTETKVTREELYKEDEPDKTPV